MRSCVLFTSLLVRLIVHIEPALSLVFKRTKLIMVERKKIPAPTLDRRHFLPRRQISQPSQFQQAELHSKKQIHNKKSGELLHEKRVNSSTTNLH